MKYLRTLAACVLVPAFMSGCASTSSGDLNYCVIGGAVAGAAAGVAVDGELIGGLTGSPNLTRGRTIKVGIIEHTARCDWTDPNDPLLYDSNGDSKASISVLTASDKWLSNELLYDWMATAASSRSNGPIEIDSLLYSNNSIYGIVARGGTADGQMVVNGAIVAADVGLLVPGNGGVGLQLNYDQRPKEALAIVSTDNVRLVRGVVTRTGIQ